MAHIICNGRKHDGLRCGAKAKFHDNTLCGTHNNQRIHLGVLWTMPVWAAPPPEHAHPVEETTNCTLCMRALTPRLRVLHARFCMQCERTRDRLDLPVEDRCQWKATHPRAKECLRAKRDGCPMCHKHQAQQQKLLYNQAWARAVLLLNAAMPDNWQPVALDIETNANDWMAIGAPNSWDRRNFLTRVAREMIIPALYNRVQEQMGRIGRMDEHGMVVFPQRWVVPNLGPPLGELAAFATDVQNVHTKATNSTTDKGLKLLLANPVTDPIDIYMMIALSIPEGTSQQRWNVVAADVMKWYDTRTCRVVGDFLYRRTLDALWVRIEASKNREELVKRLWEEWTESLGMCCDGHITRLINVLVGFDPEFLPPVSVGELLQQRMAALAELDIETEEKVTRAKAIFDELGTPEDQRGAWIEAF